jgi:hypothetical protein
MRLTDTQARVDEPVVRGVRESPVRSRAERGALADSVTTAIPVEEGWQQLLEAGLRSKTTLLKSKEFKSTAEVGDLLGIGEAAVRKRVREQKIFALKMPGDGEYRIPAWALDHRLAGVTTRTLQASAKSADEWQVYHFMSTPNGSLNGLRPFECLLSNESLPAQAHAAREDLKASLQLAKSASLLPAVEHALEIDLKQD